MNASNLVNFASQVFMLVILAAVLSIVGLGVRNILNRIFDARRQEMMKAETLVAAAKSRAAKRSLAHA